MLTFDPIRDLVMRLKDEEFYEKIYDGSKEKLFVGMRIYSWR